MSSEARPKTAKEIEKEKKKAEKLAKFQAKQAKQQQQPQQSGNKKPKQESKKEPIPEFKDETVPGQKKILHSLDDPALKAYNPKIVESSWYEWWKKQGFFAPKFDNDGNFLPKGRFVIPAPPPNITGALHIGHALTISLQDTLIRFNRMAGKTTLFLPGFDHAGISTQSVVEKMLWTRTRTTRHDYGREKFLDIVWDWKEEYHERIRKQLESLGASYDWSREVFTMDDPRSRAVTEAFVRLFDDGTIYRAERLVNWCTALRTTLSNLELEQKEIPGRTKLNVPGYDNPVEFGVLTSMAYVDKDTGEKVVIATTRPETLFGDTAVAVHPDDSRYKHLHGKTLLHPLLEGHEVPVITDAEAVDMEFGTGAVKITPAHDPNDYETGKRHNLPLISILNEDGTLNENCGPYKGMKRFDARAKVIEDLKANGLYIDQKENPMSIPTCAKSGDVIEPLLKPQWWVAQKPQAEQALKAVRTGEITVTPKSSQHEFEHWMSNIQDWCISRQLWWGHRCPVYLVEVVGQPSPNPSLTENWVAGRSYDEALAKAQEKFPGKEVKISQDEDVLDTWFSSGLWPFSTLGWPDTSSKDLKDFYPMNLLETGWDILFFWVARMIMLGIKLVGEIPFKEVFCHALVRDAQGRKMSKSLGNVVDPLDVINGISLEGLHDKLKLGNLDPREVAKAAEGQRLSYPNGVPQCGTDALRFAMCAYTTGGRDINLDVGRIEGYRKFCNKIYQATKFVLMRLGENYVPPEKEALGGNESLVEKWILHKYSVASHAVAEHLDNRQFSEAASAAYSYWLYELCDVYIENSKFLILEATPEEQVSARNTLYTAIEGGMKLLAPFMPYITEELWQRIPRRASDANVPSVSVAQFPEPEFFNPNAEQEYNLVLGAVKQARSLLADYSINRGAHLIVSAENNALAVMHNQKDMIISLVRAANTLDITEDATTPPGSVVGTVSPDCRVFLMVKGHVNLDDEIAKANKKLTKAEQLRDNAIKQTKVPGYEQKVKEAVREANSKRIEAYNAEIQGLNSVIEEFGRLKL